MSRRDETVSDAVSRGVVARAHASWTGTTFRGTRVAPRTIRRCVTASRPMEAANAAAANVWLIVPSNQRRAPARRRYARATRAELIVSLSCESLGSSSERGAVRLCHIEREARTGGANVGLFVMGPEGTYGFQYRIRFAHRLPKKTDLSFFRYYFTVVETCEGGVSCPSLIGRMPQYEIPAILVGMPEYRAIQNIEAVARLTTARANQTLHATQNYVRHHRPHLPARRARRAQAVGALTHTPPDVPRRSIPRKFCDRL